MKRSERQQAAWGRIGGLTAWSRNGTHTMLYPALNGFGARFEREVDPLGILPPEERAKRAEQARRAWMLKLAARSAVVRREGKTAPAGSSAGTVKEVADARGEPRRSD